MAAVVAEQAAASCVHGHRCALHRGAAARAVRAPAAVVAQQYRGITAAVLEHQHLAAVAQRRFDRLQRFRRQPGLQRTFAQVDDAHHRWLCVAGALAQAQVRVAAGAGVVQRLQRRRRAAQQHRHAQRLAAHEGEIARVVADPVLLLVAGVVLFVDHDQSGVGQRGEYRRAGADHHARFAAPGRGPYACALAVGQARVQRVHGYAQARAEAGQGLRGQADLRHQHQRLAPARQAVGDGLQVDLGLAAAGHAFEQERCEAGGGGDRRNRRLLFGIGRRPGLRRWCDGRRRYRDAFGVTAPGQGARGVAPGSGFQCQAVLVDRSGREPFGEVPGAAALAQARHPGGARFGQDPGPGMGVGQGFAAAQGGRQRRREHLSRRRVGVAAKPAQRVQQFAGEQRLAVGQGQGAAQFDPGLGRTHARHHAGQFAVAERNPHALPDQGHRRRDAGRWQVVEQPWQRHRQGDLQAGGGWRTGSGHRASLRPRRARPKASAFARHCSGRDR